jgi:hypothetical protein
VKTTVEPPDDLMRDLKIKAAREDRKLKDVMAELLRQSLYVESKPQKPLNRLTFPLVESTHVESTHAAAPGMTLTPDELDALLLEEEVRWAIGKE